MITLDQIEDQLEVASPVKMIRRSDAVRISLNLMRLERKTPRQKQTLNH